MRSNSKWTKNGPGSLILAIGYALSAGALAQESEPPPTPVELERSLEAWSDRTESRWRMCIDPATDFAEMVYGGAAAPPFAPSPAREADWYALARHWVTDTESLLGVSTVELVDDRFVFLPLGMANGLDKITVRLRQVVNGLPVEGAYVNALFDTRGRLLSLQSTAAPFAGNLPSVPSVGGRSAVRAAIDAFEAEEGVRAVDVGVPILLYAQVDHGAGRRAILSYQVAVKNLDVPAAKEFTVSAADGAILRRDEGIHHFDVRGTILSNATPGTEADHAGNPPVPLPMAYIDVASSVGTVQTDRDGNFVFPGVHKSLDLTVTFDGTFNRVDNTAGFDYTITFSDVPPNQDNALLMNPAPVEDRTAQANAYLHMNTVRDYIRDTVPTDDTADFQAASNVNLSDTCNAFFDGSSVNYYRAGDGCNNMAFSTVVAHELGHWLNVRYGTGNGADGMGEGNADVFAMYAFDDPVVGRFFTTGGGFVRTGENTRQFCGDGNGGCHGSVHADGEVWMGAAWKVRRNLQGTLGDALGGATADGLFVGWLNAYNQTQIRSILEIQWLTLDDDDGNIENGTPNFFDIDGAFLEQGFPGFDAQRNVVYVDVGSSPGGDGSQDDPVNTIVEGFALVAPGGQIVISGGDYPEGAFTVSREARISAPDGQVIWSN